ncbi:hypothetical protein DZF91_13595, partial [Actinomadura logoneensis]
MVSKGTSGRSSDRGKAVPAASKPGRDEATVEITPADETKHDLPKVEDKPSAAEATSVPSAAARSAASGKPAWNEPAEPADSVSADRTDARFGRAESPSAAAA